MSERTPGPWDWIKYDGRGFVQYFIVDSRGTVIAELSPPNDDDNAAFIVKACNAHDELVAERDRMQVALRYIAELSIGNPKDSLWSAKSAAYGALSNEVRAALERISDTRPK
jgi:hypothetical protein